MPERLNAKAPKENTMKIKSLFTLGIALAISASAFASEGWLSSYDAAIKESEMTGKPILAFFTGSDWCHPCQNLQKSVFDKQEFKDWAAGKAVLLELDY